MHDLDRCKCGNVPKACERGADFWVACFSCGTRSPTRTGPTKAANAWNEMPKKALPPAVAPLVEPNELTLEERLRTSHVTRWQIVRVARQQTLAEHLYLVRVITLATAKAAGFTDAEVRLAEQWALEHDVPEVVTGDLATPVKAAIRQAVPHDDPIRTIELSLSGTYADLYSQVKGTAVQDLVKMADLIEAVHFLTTEGMGTHAYAVKRRLWDTLVELVGKCQKKRPAYDWAAVYAIARKLTGA